MQTDTPGTLLTPNPVHRVWGQRRIYKPVAPAAGKEVPFTLGQSMLWRVIAFTVSLKTSAQAAKRIPALQVSDGDENPLMVIGGQSEVAEGLTKRVTFAPEVAQNTSIAAGPVTIGIPWLLLLPGYSITTITAGIQTEDEYLKPTLWVEEFEQVQHHPLAELAAEVSMILTAKEALHYAAG